MIDVAAERAASLERDQKREAEEAERPIVIEFRALRVLEYATRKRRSIEAAALKVYSLMDPALRARIVEHAERLRAAGKVAKQRNPFHNVKAHKAEREALRAVDMKPKPIKKRKWEATMPKQEDAPKTRATQKPQPTLPAPMPVLPEGVAVCDHLDGTATIQIEMRVPHRLASVTLALFAAMHREATEDARKEAA